MQFHVFNYFIMADTPSPSVSVGDRDPCRRLFGGRFPDLMTNVVVKHNISDQPVVRNAFVGVAFAKLEHLHVFVVPAMAVEDLSVNIYLGWGHSEHSMPVDIGQLSQLPSFRVISYGKTDVLGSRELNCDFSQAVVPQLKPVLLEGGRPSLYCFAEAVDNTGKPVKAVVARLFFRATLVTSGFDITFA